MEVKGIDVIKQWSDEKDLDDLFLSWFDSLSQDDAEFMHSFGTVIYAREAFKAGWKAAHESVRDSAKRGEFLGVKK